MAIPVAIAGLAMSAYQASQQKKAGNAAAGEAMIQGQRTMSEAALNKELNDLEARDTMTAAQQQADDIKRQHMAYRGQLAVSQAGSGVIAGDGSAQAAQDQLDTLAAADALATMFSGVNRASSVRATGRFQQQAGAESLAAAGRNAASISQSAVAQARGTLLSGAIKAAGSMYSAGGLGGSSGGGFAGTSNASFFYGNRGSGD